MRRAVVAGVFVVMVALVAWRLRPPDPLPASAPAREFSAARANILLTALLREGVPHPVGSPANAVVRDRIISRFQSLGYSTAIQRAYSCNRRGRCATVENVLATRNAPPAVLALAHYDSVPRGPGASDDGAGVVAVLEIARAVRGERFRNPVGFLITDGEERGLLGAEAFARDPQLSRSVRAVVNLENRGTSGPSYLFETSRNNYELAQQAARHLQKPSATSLFPAVYDLMPNDTDVSVFKRAGKAAVNFAAIGDVRYYHTAQDDLAHVSLGTLQQAGDNSLAMFRAIANSDLTPRHGDAVFFDILGLTIIYWPAAWTIWIVVAGAVVLLAGIRDVGIREVAIGSAAFIASVTAAGVIGLTALTLSPRRMPHPEPVIATMWIAGIAVTCLATAVAARRATARGLFAGYAVVWLLISAALAVTLPGVSFLFVAPAAVAAVFSHSRSEVLTAVAWLVAAGIVFFPLALMIYTALGALGLLADALLLAIVATTFAPAVASATSH